MQNHLRCCHKFHASVDGTPTYSTYCSYSQYRCKTVWSAMPYQKDSQWYQGRTVQRRDYADRGPWSVTPPYLWPVLRTIQGNTAQHFLPHCSLSPKKQDTFWKHLVPRWIHRCHVLCWPCQNSHDLQSFRTEDCTLRLSNAPWWAFSK